MRHDPVTGRWVIYALSRRKRPGDIARSDRRSRTEPAFDERCPFCPGHEGSLPGIIMEYGGRASPWGLRVVKNKYPALTPDGGLERSRQGIYLRMEGYGHHEIVIETPVHNRQIPSLSGEEMELIIEAYHRRYLDLMEYDRNMLIVIFRNHGPRAGASLIHPHSQIIATGLVPGHIREREYRAERYFDECGRCLYCDMIREELSARARIIHENPSFVCFVPYAASQPFEVSIMPRAHKAHFGEISDREKTDLAACLRGMVELQRSALGDPDYNYVIHSSAKFRAGEPQAHWFLKLRPRLSVPAGFEIGSGMSISTSLPEEDAAFLRAAESEKKGARDDLPA